MCRRMVFERCVAAKEQCLSDVGVSEGDEKKASCEVDGMSALQDDLFFRNGVPLLVYVGQRRIVAGVAEHLGVVGLGVVEGDVCDVSLRVAFGVVNGVDEALVG